MGRTANEISGLREAGDYPAGRAIPSAGSAGAAADRNPEIHVLSMVRSLSDRRARGSGRLTGCWSIVSMASNSSWRSSQEQRSQTTFTCLLSTRRCARDRPCSSATCSWRATSKRSSVSSPRSSSAGERGVYDRYGQSFPRIDVTLDDMQRCGEKPSSFVLTVKEMADEVSHNDSNDTNCYCRASIAGHMRDFITAKR